MAKLSVFPRSRVNGVGVYDHVALARLHEMGLSAETAIVAAAYEERVPIQRLAQLLELPRLQIAQRLDEYLQAKGIREADARAALVRSYDRN